MSGLLGPTVLVPLLGALCCAALPRRYASTIAMAAAVCTGGLVTVLAVQVFRGGQVSVDASGYAAPLGIALVADGLSVAFLCMTAVVGAALTVYASGDAGARGGPMYWALWLALWAALNAVYLSGDLFNIYVALELMGLSAIGLVALAGRGALPAALRYLFVAVLGSLAWLVGVGLIYGETGTLDLRQIGAVAERSAPLTAALILMTLGMALKSALFPLHGWLPAAHGGAPSAVSPALSALVIKASVYVLIRLWSTALPGVGGPAMAHVLGGFGAVAVFWGTLLALRQDRLKLVVAYSTVAQVGYLVMIFPLALAGPIDAGPIDAGPIDAGPIDAGAARDGWVGPVLLGLSHGLAKAAMFMAAGTLALAHGTDRLAGLVGAATRRPVACATFALAGVSLAGLPPSLGFSGKWLVIQSSLTQHQWWWALLVLAGGLCTAAYVGRVLRVCFADPSRDGNPPSDLRPVPRRMEAAGMVLALISVVLGLRVLELFQLVAEAAPGGGST